MSTDEFFCPEIVFAIFSESTFKICQCVRWLDSVDSLISLSTCTFCGIFWRHFTNSSNLWKFEWTSIEIVDKYGFLKVLDNVKLHVDKLMNQNAYQNGLFFEEYLSKYLIFVYSSSPVICRADPYLSPLPLWCGYCLGLDWFDTIFFLQIHAGDRCSCRQHYLARWEAGAVTGRTRTRSRRICALRREIL